MDEQFSAALVSKVGQEALTELVKANPACAQSSSSKEVMVKNLLKFVERA